jgi:hypothetical protein
MSFNSASSLCSTQIYYSVAFASDFGVQVTSPVTWWVPSRKTTEKYYYFCYNPEAKIHMYSGEKKNAEDVRIGDVLVSPEGQPTTVLRIKTTVYFSVLLKTPN